MVVGIALCSNDVGGFAVGSDFYHAAVFCGPPGALALMLALLPTDRRAIYRVLAFFSVALTLASLVLFVVAARDTPGVGAEGRACLERKPAWFCGVVAAGQWLKGAITLATVAGLVSALWLPTRASLDRLWHCAAFVWFGVGAARLAQRVAAQVRPGGLRPGQHVGEWLILGSYFFFGACAVWPSFRQRAHSALLARGGQISSAAGVAALLGDHDVDEVKLVARSKFFGVDVARVELAHIQKSTPDPELFKLAKPAEYGQVDWFVSHSWREDADAKYDALQEARARFREEHKRDPVIWLDKFCIDQRSIEENLMCLPVFLAGCNQLFILCGETYLERLWCMLELFVFIQMGGRVDDVELFFIAPDGARPARPPSARTPSLGFFRTPSRQRGALEAPPEEPPLDEPGRVKAFFEQQFERFDVARASCYDAVQRDRLLAIVEAGFGGLPAFNDALKETMRALKAKGRYTLVKKNGAVSCAASP